MGRCRTYRSCQPALLLRLERAEPGVERGGRDRRGTACWSAGTHRASAHRTALCELVRVCTRASPGGGGRHAAVAHPAHLSAWVAPGMRHVNRVLYYILSRSSARHAHVAGRARAGLGRRRLRLRNACATSRPPYPRYSSLPGVSHGPASHPRSIPQRSRGLRASQAPMCVLRWLMPGEATGAHLPPPRRFMHAHMHACGLYVGARRPAGGRTKDRRRGVLFRFCRGRHCPMAWPPDGGEARHDDCCLHACVSMRACVRDEASAAEGVSRREACWCRLACRQLAPRRARCWPLDVRPPGMAWRSEQKQQVF